MSLEVKSKLVAMRTDAINRLVNLNGTDLSEYRHQQGIIQGFNLALGVVEQDMKEQDNA